MCFVVIVFSFYSALCTFCLLSVICCHMLTNKGLYIMNGESGELGEENGVTTTRGGGHGYMRQS